MEDTEMIDLGRRLRRERERHHWTQEQLGENIHYSVISINRWEHGKSKIKQDAVTQLSAVFGKPPERWGVSYWHVPFLRNPYFTGRDQLLLRLHKALGAENTATSSQNYAISGLGGIGKTQTALEYAYRYANEYEAILWIRADSHETLISDFARLAQMLDLPLKETADQLQMVAAVKRWLEVHGPWLLIFDNVDDLSVASNFLLRLPVGASLLTTRSRIIGSNIVKIEMAKMNREEGASFLLRRSASSGKNALSKSLAEREHQAIQELWEVMDGLPLALDQAGAYIEATQCRFCDYVDLYRQHRKDLLRERGGAILEYPASVATTWSVSFQRVEQKDPAASELLRLSAFLSPDAIPEELLTCGAAHLTPALQEMTGSALLLNRAISTLSTYSLVQRDSTEKTFSIHRLVQAVLQDEQEPQEHYLWAERVIQAVNAAFPHVEYETWPQCERLLAQAFGAIEWMEQYHLMTQYASRLLSKVASYLQARARYEEAEPLYLRAVAMCEQCLDQDPAEVTILFDDLANLYRDQGKYAKAEALYQRALAIRKAQLGPEHLQVATSLNNLAILYKEQGNYAKAAPFYQQALAIREEQLGSEHLQIATSLNGLALLYKEQGNYVEAEPLYQRALAIREERLGPEHPQVAVSLCNLGMLYSVQGKYTEAVHLFQRILAIDTQAYGENHPELATDVNNLAILYFEQGKYTEAGPLFQRALHIWDAQLGPEHPHVARALNNLAQFYTIQGKYEEAESLYQRALHIWAVQFEADHPDGADPLEGLANLYKEQGRYTEAEPLYQRALHVLERTLGVQHSATGGIMHSFAQLREAQGNSEEARDWYAHALAVREQALGTNHPKTMETRKQLNNLLMQ